MKKILDFPFILCDSACPSNKIKIPMTGCSECFYCLHEKKRHIIMPWQPFNHCLALLSPSLADLSRETGLDGSHTSSRTAGVACDKVQSVFTLVEFCIWRSAGLASDIFHFCVVSIDLVGAP